MSAFDYAELADTAAEILAEYGQTVTRTASTAGSYNPATGSVTVTTANTSRVGADFAFGQGATTVRGQMIQKNDRRLLLDADGPVAMTDSFTIGGKNFTVVSFDQVAPAGVAVMYDIHIRSA